MMTFEITKHNGVFEKAVFLAASCYCFKHRKRQREEACGVVPKGQMNMLVGLQSRWESDSRGFIVTSDVFSFFVTFFLPCLSLVSHPTAVLTTVSITLCSKSKEIKNTVI